MNDPQGTAPRWELYRLLAEPMRLRLLALSAEEELAIGELAEVVGESQPNVSRHVAPLKQAGLVTVRKQGTRAFVRLRAGAAEDPVVADALSSGRELCASDGSLARVNDVLRARDALAREFFAKARARGVAASPSSADLEAAEGRAPLATPVAELGAYLAALAPLLRHHALAIDAGTGDGGLLDVLAPVFTRVVAVDRSEAQLAQARARVTARGYANVDVVRGELDGAAVRRAAPLGADAVFAVRLLHHAPSPAQSMKQLASLVAPGGAVVVVDYGRHDDEAMREQADLWLGFEPDELRDYASSAGLEGASVTRVAPRLVGLGPDAHLPWQIMVARRPALAAAGATVTHLKTTSERITARERTSATKKTDGVDHGER